MKYNNNLLVFYAAVSFSVFAVLMILGIDCTGWQQRRRLEAWRFDRCC
jgi:hypothetical protein